MTGDELLDLLDTPLYREVVVAGQLDEPRARDVLGVPPPLVKRNEAITLPVQYQRWHLNSREDVSNVLVENHSHICTGCGRRARQALHAGKRGTPSQIVDAARRDHLDPSGFVGIPPTLL